MTLREAHTHTKTFTLTRGKQLLFALCGFSALFFVLYMYLLSTTVFNIVVRKNIESTIREKTTEISDLQLAVLSRSTTLDKSYIASAGFVTPAKTTFVSRTTFVGAAPTTNHAF